MAEEKKIEGQGGTSRYTDAEIQQMLKRKDKAVSASSTFRSNMQEIAEYMIPERANITEDDEPGAKKTSKIYDTTAVDALELWASGLNGLMTNESLDWFALSMEDEDLNDIQEVSAWLEDCVERMHRSIRASNFQMEIYECYLDAGSLGTTSLYIEEGKNTDLNFQARHINEIAILENSQGYVDTLFREFEFTARQAKDQFGYDKLTKDMKDAIDRAGREGGEEDETFTIVHCIYPRGDDKRYKDDSGRFKETPESLPVASLYIATDGEGSGELLDEGGYYEFPYAVPRTKKMTGEIYGRSPAWNALPDIKMVNAMCKTYIRAIQKMTDPPVQMPDEGYAIPPNLGPGGVNYFSSVGGVRDARIEPISTGSQPQFADDEIDKRRTSIRNKFFYDLWILPEQPNMTATEVLERIQQKLRIIGPFLGRFQYELLKPIVTRVFGILYRAGKFLDPPRAVAESGRINVVFISPISDAQQAYQAETINKAIMMIAPLAQADPSIMDNFDRDGVARTYWKDLRAPTSLLINFEDVKKQRKAQMEQMQQDKKAAELLAMTEGAKNLKGTGLIESATGGMQGAPAE